MIKGFRHTGVVVDDLDKSIRFYRDLLGFKVEKRQFEGVEYIRTLLGNRRIDTLETVKLSAGNGVILELLKFNPSAESDLDTTLFSTGLTHLAFTVECIDDVYRKMMKQGVEFISEPEVSPDGYAKLVFCKAPDGVYLEMVEIL